MPDLTSPLLIHLKGALFLLLGVLATGLVLVECPRWRTAAQLAIGVWAFCRSYYYAFYVIERYVDPAFRFSGLLSVARYLAGAARRR